MARTPNKREIEEVKGNEVAVTAPSEVFGHSGPVGEMANLPPDLALIRMENESIMAMATARPRDYRRILADLKDQLESYPSFSASAIYRKPVGKDPKTGQEVVVPGLSIRAAEAIREAYGYNRVACTVDRLDADTVRITASFIDYQRGSIWQDSSIVSAFYKDRYGKMQRWSDDRFYNVVVKAEKSKLIREVILRSVPAGLKSELFILAERELGSKLDENTVNRILDEFRGKGVTREQLEEYRGKTTENWTQDDKVSIVGLWQAIEDGEVSVEDTFGPAGKAAAHEGAQKPEPPATSKAPGAIHPQDLIPKERVREPDPASQPAQAETTPVPEPPKPKDAREPLIEEILRLGDALGLLGVAKALDGTAFAAVKVTDKIRDIVEGLGLYYRMTGHVIPQQLNLVQCEKLIAALRERATPAA